MSLRISHLISISIILALGVTGLGYTLVDSFSSETIVLEVKDVQIVADRTKLEFTLEGKSAVAEPIRPVVKLASGLKRYTIEANSDFLLMPSQSNKVLLDFDPLAIDNGEYTLEAYVLTTAGKSESFERLFRKKGSDMSIEQSIESSFPLWVVFLGGMLTTGAFMFFVMRQKFPVDFFQNGVTKVNPETTNGVTPSQEEKVSAPIQTVAKEMIDNDQLGQDLQKLRELCEKNIIDVETYKTKRQEILKKLQPQQS